jgi:tRNA(Ile)-lysidine synthase
VKYILAISGGVDSVALLDMVAKGKLLKLVEPKDLMIAHFDHGMRDNSANDAELVKKLAAKYQIEYAVGDGNLGKNASEQLARTKRYEFLRSFCKTRSCKIMVAHHQDDLLETIVMNLIRGTGWRGLVPFWSDDILRPLLDMTKSEIINYAIEHDLNWVEDETNDSAKYFRNRVRDFITRLSTKDSQRLLDLSQKQSSLRVEIEDILTTIPMCDSYRIENITKLPDDLAIEVLRMITSKKLTIPQLRRLLKNLKNAKSGDVFQPGGEMQVGVYRDRLVISELQ